MLRHFCVLWLGVFVCGIACDCAADESEAKGKWIRTLPNGTRHLVKEIGDDQETLSAYDVSGELIYQHVVKYEVTPLEGLCVFAFWDRQVVVDTSKTEEEIAAGNQELREASSEPIRYLFKIQGDQWFEVHQLWEDAEAVPNMNTFTRLEDDAKLPWEKEQVADTLRPKDVMNYFAGMWQLKGKAGENEYQGRSNSEWDLHHQALVGTHEFFGVGGEGGTVHSYWMWDKVTNRLVDRHFTSWGAYREASYRIVPEGEYFKLVGVGMEHAPNAKRSSDVEITVVDQNHHTWRVIPHDKSRPEMVEQIYRITALRE